MLPFGGNNKNSGDLSIYMHYKSAESTDFFCFADEAAPALMRAGYFL